MVEKPAETQRAAEPPAPAAAPAPADAADPEQVLLSLRNSFVSRASSSSMSVTEKPSVRLKSAIRTTMIAMRFINESRRRIAVRAEGADELAGYHFVLHEKATEEAKMLLAAMRYTDIFASLASPFLTKLVDHYELRHFKEEARGAPLPPPAPPRARASPPSAHPCAAGVPRRRYTGWVRRARPSTSSPRACSSRATSPRAQSPSRQRRASRQRRPTSARRRRSFPTEGAVRGVSTWAFAARRTRRSPARLPARCLGHTCLFFNFSTLLFFTF